MYYLLMKIPPAPTPAPILFYGKVTGRAMKGPFHHLILTTVLGPYTTKAGMRKAAARVVTKHKLAKVVIDETGPEVLDIFA